MSREERQKFEAERDRRRAEHAAEVERKRAEHAARVERDRAAHAAGTYVPPKLPGRPTPEQQMAAADRRRDQTIAAMDRRREAYRRKKGW